ncbi:ABC transporter substrate-binding protein [Bradyrhizobium sp. LLZ17]|uniref:ABC transporter substrate-binding protein n=1 Tax=Bradyrhizobium sp. LLZ17 TaxID=3239388 RepID=A0AB39XTR5_9BRAD
MKRRDVIVLLGLSMASPAAAQMPQPTLGLLSFSELADWAIKPFRAGLEQGGYIEGRNLTIVYRSAEQQFDHLPALAAQLVESRVSVIFATGSPVPARAAKAATTSIPIVFAYGGDPVGDGLVASFSRPGGNVTGATFIGTELVSKRMGILREIMPEVSDVALLVNPKGTLADVQIKEATAAAQSLGLTLHVVNVSSESEFDEAFATMRKLKVGAFLSSTDPLFGFSGRNLHIEKGLGAGIPPICVGNVDVADGCLFSYGPNLSDTWRQAGVYVTRILKGQKPADLPVVQPTKFDLVINLKVALQLGIHVPPTLIARAEQVIE